MTTNDSIPTSHLMQRAENLQRSPRGVMHAHLKAGREAWREGQRLVDGPLGVGVEVVQRELEDARELLGIGCAAQANRKHPHPGGLEGG